MKRYRQVFPLILSIIILFSICFLPVPALAAEEISGTLTDAQEDEYSGRLAVNGNFNVTLTYVAKGDRPDSWTSMELALYDADFSEDAEHLSSNYLLLRHKAVYLYETSAVVDEDLRWSDDAVTYGDCDEDKVLTDTTMTLNVRRWKNRIRVTLTDTEGKVYWNLLYKAKADMADVLYLRLFSIVGAATDIQFTVGQTESYWDTFMWEEGWVTVVAIVVVILLLLLNWLSTLFEKEIFDESFNTITGGLWGIAILFIACMPFSGGRDFLNQLIHEFVGISWITIPGPKSVWFWVVMVICVVYAAVIWYLAVIEECNNPFIATLLMLVLGALHGFTLIVLAILAIALLLIVVGLLVLGGFMGAVGSSDNEKPASEPEPEPQPEPKKDVKVWREDEYGNREYLKVGTSGEYYWDPDVGDWVKIKK